MSVSVHLRQSSEDCGSIRAADTIAVGDSGRLELRNGVRAGLRCHASSHTSVAAQVQALTCDPIQRKQEDVDDLIERYTNNAGRNEARLDAS